MGSVLGIVESPLFLGILMFFGVVGLIRVLLARDPTLKRAPGVDRRRTNGKMPATPFQDSDGVQVTENRRRQTDRRRTRLSAMQAGIKRDNALG